MMRTLITVLLLTALTATAQQKGGDKEFGIGGSVNVSHSSPRSGNASAQVSLGRFLTRSHFVGVQAIPTVTFAEDANRVGGFFGGNYRYLIGGEQTRVFPFVGAGTGVWLLAREDSRAAACVLGEVGFKAYASQRTSFEAAYNFIYFDGESRAGRFSGNTLSQIVFSVRHLF